MSKAGKLAGIWEPAVEEVELRPIVVVPMCEVPAGKMPRTAGALVRQALKCGYRVWSTYALALVPGVRRKDGDNYARITLTLESVAVRLRLPGRERRAWAMWHNGSFQQAWARDGSTWAIQLGSKELSEWVNAIRLSD